jgi:hypothetical protein
VVELCYLWLCMYLCIHLPLIVALVIALLVDHVLQVVVMHSAVQYSPDLLINEAASSTTVNEGLCALLDCSVC